MERTDSRKKRGASVRKRAKGQRMNEWMGGEFGADREGNLRSESANGCIVVSYDMVRERDREPGV